MMETITGFIYYLQNPTTGEIFYVGATEHPLNKRLWRHYQNLKEFERGARRANRRFLYLQNLLPIKATIHLLENVTTKEQLKNQEVFHINHFRAINPNLTNMTDGGTGQHTSKYYTEAEMEEYSAKLSKANSGRTVPQHIKDQLSETRMGINNPGAKAYIDPIVCIIDTQTTRVFLHSFEIDDFIGKVGAASNVSAYLKRGGGLCYKYKWRYLSQS